MNINGIIYETGITSRGHRSSKKPFLSDNCTSCNMNDNPKNNILMSENIRQNRPTILEYFDAYICHHCQLEISFCVNNEDKYMHNPILLQSSQP